MSLLRTTPTALLMSLALAACGLPRVPVKQTFERTASVRTATGAMHTYVARDFKGLDTSAKILRMEYLPVTMVAVVDERDSIDYLVAVAWQELLWRFSEKLSELDKGYYAPTLRQIARAGDTAVVTWAYPNLDTRDDDLRSITPYRNSYWSVDLFRGSTGREEIFRGDLRSHPQYTPYDPLRRFVDGGTWDRAAADSAPPYRALRTYLESTIDDGADTARR